MTEKLARRGLKIHAEYEPDVLTQVTVGEAMNPDVPAVEASMKVKDLAAMMGSGHLGKHYALPITNGNGELVGIITRGDVVKRLEREPESAATVLDAGTPNPVVCYPDEILHQAVERMLKQEVGRLPVVSRDNPKKLVGYLGRAGVMAARMRRIREEHQLERGWWGSKTSA